MEFWRKTEKSCINTNNTRSNSPTYQSYQDLLVEEEIDCRNDSATSNKVFATVEEMQSIVARAELEAELDNALLQLHEGTRRCLRGSRKRSNEKEIKGEQIPGDVFNTPGSLSSFEEYSSSSKHDSNTPTRNSISLCGFSSSSGDSAISTAHSQSEISGPKELRLSFIYLQTMATLEESRLSYLDDTSVMHLRDVEPCSKRSSQSFNESLNLSEYSSGTSNFESDCDEDYDLPGPTLHIDETPSASPIPRLEETDSIALSRKSSFDHFTLGAGSTIMNTTDSRTNTLQSNSTTLSSNMSTIFSGGYTRAGDCQSDCTPSDDGSQRYRLSEYHYSKLAASQSLNKCQLETIDTPAKRRTIRRCLSAPDVAPFLNCNNCQVLKHSLCELLTDCGELNQMLKTLILILHEPPKQSSFHSPNQLHPNLMSQISSIDQMITKKQSEIDALIQGLNNDL